MLREEAQWQDGDRGAPFEWPQPDWPQLGWPQWPRFRRARRWRRSRPVEMHRNANEGRNRSNSGARARSLRIDEEPIILLSPGFSQNCQYSFVSGFNIIDGSMDSKSSDVQCWGIGNEDMRVMVVYWTWEHCNKVAIEGGDVFKELSCSVLRPSK